MSLCREAPGKPTHCLIDSSCHGEGVSDKNHVPEVPFSLLTISSSRYSDVTLRTTLQTDNDLLEINALFLSKRSGKSADSKIWSELTAFVMTLPVSVLITLHQSESKICFVAMWHRTMPPRRLRENIAKTFVHGYGSNAVSVYSDLWLCALTSAWSQKMRDENDGQISSHCGTFEYGMGDHNARLSDNVNPYNENRGTEFFNGDPNAPAFWTNSRFAVVY
ncbi:hypothetical protein BD410DRAFT_809020 [Rickenella mellea]|uniref:Uncharacterized protein n=1 Tax=Rickenella mellea TaxID=50990 RepID=A0A4Y7PJB9_9AGAM|nr:hypothetical protein BD410DRAFT_809020 [Rickenella mellea]